MSNTQQTISPVDGTLYVERKLATDPEIETTLKQAVTAQANWSKLDIAKRAELCHKAVDAFVANKEAIAGEITRQMGRPIQYATGEVGGFEERARYMIDIAGQKLGDIPAEKRAGFTRFIRREPLGVVFTIAPWNYPYLTAVNSVIPAIMAGNSVILKHSAQTPLCAERFVEAFAAAGLPEGVFQYLHLSHSTVAKVIQSPEVNHVAFTGSVAGGVAVEKAASGLFKGVGLELGGKDPAYVRADADLGFAVENLVDGAFFNSGQSCCGIERIYVHSKLYDDFVAAFVELVGKYRLGNPLERETTLGPMVRARAADFVRGQIAHAIQAGARALINPKAFSADQPGSAYLAPQVLVDVDHSMQVMTEETFGPVIGIMKVASDEEALKLMNDSEFGLTASLWSSDPESTLALAEQVQTGTCFMNRCDYLDPSLAWTGIKNSGRGCTLSEIGYEQLTRPKSFHLRTEV